MSKKTNSNENTNSVKSINSKKMEGIANMSMPIITFALVVVGILQVFILMNQAKISENANKLAMYQYRFDFYEKLSDVQKLVSKIELNPTIEIDAQIDITYKLLSLTRESKMLFDEKLQNRINDILARHIDFCNKIQNNEITKEEYGKVIYELNKDYGNFLISEDFLEYLNLNLIKN